MFARVTATDFHWGDGEFADARLTEVGRVKVNADEHPGGAMAVLSKQVLLGGALRYEVTVEVGPSPAFGNDDEEPGFRAVFVLEPLATLGFEL